MGEALRVGFERRLKLEFHGSKVASDAGLLAYRKLDEALGLTVLVEERLHDWRTGKNMQHTMVALLRQVVTTARHIVFQMAEVAIRRGLFRAILERIRRLRPPAAVPG